MGPCTDCGIFTQTLGTAPNRQFVIRWKTNYFNSPPGPAQAEFEVLLTEGSDTLSVIYGATGDNGLTAASGIQQDLNVFTSFSCNEATLTPGLRVNYIPTPVAVPRRPRRRQLQPQLQPQPQLRHSYSHGHGYGNRYADSYCGTASNSDTAAAANTGASPVGRSGSEKMISD